MTDTSSRAFGSFDELLDWSERNAEPAKAGDAEEEPEQPEAGEDGE